MCAQVLDVKATETVALLKKKLENYDFSTSPQELGEVVSVADGVAVVSGIDSVQLGEVVGFVSDVQNITGMVQLIDDDSVKVIILGDDSNVKEGLEVRRLNRFVEASVGMKMIGRVVNALSEPIDDLGPIDDCIRMNVEAKAPGVISRQSVHEPMQTGIKAIDALVPIGRGQRELIIGDRKTGKTTVAVDTILNQKKINDEAFDDKSKVFCIYVAIGQKQSTVANVVDTLRKGGAMEYTTVVVAGASDSASMQFIAPYAGCAMGEFFRDNGMHCLIVYDDLSKHAVSYRQISLLLRRPPGREAFPGDVFYLHSRLLERAAKMSDVKDSGSLTALPIIETQAGDVSAYIPTNVISITDGQIFLDADLYNSGVMPAINVGLSVSRVGSSAQVKAMKQVAGSIKLELAQYREMEAFAQFGSDLDQSTRDLLDRGSRLVELLKQEQNSPMSVQDQVVVIYCAVNGFMSDISSDLVSKFCEELLSFMRVRHPDVLSYISKTGALSDAVKSDLDAAIKSFVMKSSSK